MKTSERHQLKSNEVAAQVVRARAWASDHGTRAAWIAAAVLLVALVAGGVWTWRQRTQDRASAVLAEAMVIAETPLAAAGAIPQKGAFATEKERDDAAVKKLLEVVEQYPSTPAGITARYQAAVLLVAQGRTDEARTHFQAVADAGSGVHARMARMAMAELQVNGGQYDEAIAAYRDLAARKDGDLPVDGLLMQLGRVYALAGKRTEALQTYQRIITEFPDSVYAAEAQRAADALKVQASS